MEPTQSSGSTNIETSCQPSSKESTRTVIPIKDMIKKRINKIRIVKLTENSSICDESRKDLEDEKSVDCQITKCQDINFTPNLKDSMSDCQTKYREWVKLTPIKNVKIIKFNPSVSRDCKRTTDPYSFINVNHNPGPRSNSKSNNSRSIIAGAQLRPLKPLEAIVYEQIEWMPEERYITDLDKESERIEYLLLPYANRIIFQESNYNEMNPTVFFQYPKCCKKMRRLEQTFTMTQYELGSNFFSFSVSETTCVYKCVCKVLKYAGFRVARGSRWNLLWTGANKGDVVSPLDIFQKTNHFPGIFQIGRKDNLCRNINRLKRIHGREYNICPLTYVLPEDLQRFTKDRESREMKNWIWIMKPSASSCGRGIRLLGPNSLLDITEYVCSWINR